MSPVEEFKVWHTALLEKVSKRSLGVSSHQISDTILGKTYQDILDTISALVDTHVSSVNPHGVQLSDVSGISKVEVDSTLSSFPDMDRLPLSFIPITSGSIEDNHCTVNPFTAIVYGVHISIPSTTLSLAEGTDTVYVDAMGLYLNDNTRSGLPVGKIMDNEYLPVTGHYIGNAICSTVPTNSAIPMTEDTPNLVSGW